MAAGWGSDRRALRLRQAVSMELLDRAAVGGQDADRRVLRADDAGGDLDGVLQHALE